MVADTPTAGAGDTPLYAIPDHRAYCNYHCSHQYPARWLDVPISAKRENARHPNRCRAFFVAAPGPPDQPARPSPWALQAAARRPGDRRTIQAATRPRLAHKRRRSTAAGRLGRYRPTATAVYSRLGRPGAYFRAVFGPARPSTATMRQRAVLSGVFTK